MSTSDNPLMPGLVTDDEAEPEDVDVDEPMPPLLDDDDVLDIGPSYYDLFFHGTDNDCESILATPRSTTREWILTRTNS